MLIYRSWMDTRWRFTIGLLVLICAAAGLVMIWPKTLQLLPLAEGLDIGGEIGRRIHEAIEVQRSWRGYIWHQGFSQNFTKMATLLAVLLGSGGLLMPSRSALFTLSLPVSRNRITLVRAATALVELLILAFATSLSILVLAPLVGERYAFSDAAVHTLCLFSASAVFLGLACLLSTMFFDLWRPLGIALAAAVTIGLLETFTDGLFGFGVFRLMSGEAWFRQNEFPWMGVLASLSATGGLIWTAALNTSRRDF